MMNFHRINTTIVASKRRSFVRFGLVIFAIAILGNLTFGYWSDKANAVTVEEFNKNQKEKTRLSLQKDCWGKTASMFSKPWVYLDDSKYSNDALDSEDRLHVKKGDDIYLMANVFFRICVSPYYPGAGTVGTFYYVGGAKGKFDISSNDTKLDYTLTNQDGSEGVTHYISSELSAYFLIPEIKCRSVIDGPWDNCYYDNDGTDTSGAYRKNPVQSSAKGWKIKISSNSLKSGNNTIGATATYDYANKKYCPDSSYCYVEWVGDIKGTSGDGVNEVYATSGDGIGSGIANIVIYVDPDPTWALTATVKIRKGVTGTFGTTDINALIGVDTVEWEHKASTLTDSDDPTIETTVYGIEGAIAEASGGTQIGSKKEDIGKGGSSTITTTKNFSSNWPTSGTKTCRYTRTSDSSYESGSQTAVSSSPSVLCVTWQYDWHIDLETTTPTITEDNYTPSTAPTPGDVITWNHKARQMGPTITDAQANFTITHSNTLAAGVSNWNTSTTSSTVLNKLTNFAKYRAKDSAMVEVSTSKDSRKILQADVGGNLCSKITASPGGGGNYSKSARSSTNSCVFVPYNYQLTPNSKITQTDSDSSTINYDDPVSFSGVINNSGPTKSKSTNWEAFTFVVPNTNRTVPSEKLNSSYTNALSNSYLNTIYGLTGIKDYQVIGSKTTKNLSNGGCTTHNPIDVFYPTKINTEDPASTDNTIVCATNDLKDLVNQLNLGDRLCFAIWVSPSWAEPNNQNPTNNRSYSKPSCVTVAKTPQLQLRGADSKSGATQFGKTSLTNTDNTLPNQYQGGFNGTASANPARGSWSQYGLLSTGTGKITNFGSTGYTSAFSTTVGATNAKPFCKLLFANTGKSDSTDDSSGGSNCTGGTNETYGNMNSLAAGNGRIITLPKTAELTDIPNDTPASNRLTTASQLSNLNLNSLNSGTYYASSNLTISPSSLGSNKHLTIVVLNTPTNQNASVTITGNITDNNATYSSLDQIPSLTIIANHIYVSGNVTKLYGTYIARDRFNTCNDPSLSSQPGFNLNQTLAGIGNSSDGAWSAACKNQLTITGALISKNRPSFLRTNGAGRDDTSTPAEIIQYSPNLYLTPYSLSKEGNMSNWRLGDLRQLPARL